MGISLGLDIVAMSIDARTWETVYDESLRLLRAHPARLVALDEEQVRGLRRLVYTRALERDVGGPGHRWHVVGDHRSGQLGESFELYRDLGHYRGARRRPTSESARDAAVEFSRAPDARRERSRSTSVFSEKTQGCPYHDPLVAVLALVEERLGAAAYAHGDISPKRAARACAWASRVLGRRLDPPVCVRPSALHERLAKKLEGDTLLDACFDLHVGSGHRMLTILGMRTDRPALERWFGTRLRKLAGSGSPATIGVLQLLTAWLDAGLEFEVLAAIACTRREGPRFAPAELAHAAVIARRAELKGGLEARLHAWLSSMGLPVLEPEKRPERVAWPTKRGLIARLGRLYPDERTAIAAAIERAWAEVPATERPAARERELKPSTKLKDLLTSVPAAFEGDGAPLTATGLLLRNAALAASQAGNAILDHPQIGLALREGPGTAWRVVVAMAEGRALFEDTWAALDAERDVDFLSFILGLLSLAGREPNATACRALLWDLPLCRRLHKATEDASWRRSMNEVVADLHEQGPDKASK